MNGLASSNQEDNVGANTSHFENVHDSLFAMYLDDLYNCYRPNRSLGD